MYKRNNVNKTSLSINKSYEGETIEQKVERITLNKEPIKDAAPLIYTEKHEGVLPGYDIRHSKWDIAVDAMDKGATSNWEHRKKAMEQLKKSKEKPSEQAKKAEENSQSEASSGTSEQPKN